MKCDYCQESVIQLPRDLAKVDANFFALLSQKYPNFSEDYCVPLSLTDRTLRKTKSSSGTVVCLCEGCYHRIKIMCRGSHKISDAIDMLLTKSVINK